MEGKVILVVCILAALVYPVSGAINTITAGDTVFIGEENLDVSGALGSNDKIAFFVGSGTAPERVITVTSMTSFYVSPIDFSDRTGVWYAWSDSASKATAPVAFYVDAPYLRVKVRDADLDIDVTNKWIPRGDNAGFSIETNLGVMAQRGIAGAPITLKVQSPSGTTYSSLADAAGTVQSLDLEVPTSPYNPGISWYTGDSQYSSGTYTVYLECDANNMKDNYMEEGTTVSSKVTVLVQSKNPLISNPTATTAPVTTATTVATTVATMVPTSPPTTATIVPVTTTAAVTTAAVTTEAITTVATPAIPTTVPGFGTGIAVLAIVSLLLFARRN